jgi:hypothetical protein
MCTDKCDSIRCKLGSVQGSVLLYVQVEDLFLTVCCSCWIFPDMARRHSVLLDTEVHHDLHLMRLKAETPHQMRIRTEDSERGDGDHVDRTTQNPFTPVHG